MILCGRLALGVSPGKVPLGPRNPYSDCLPSDFVLSRNTPPQIKVKTMGNFRSIKRKISSFLTSCLVNNAYIVIVETTYPIKFPVALYVRIKTRFAYFLKRATPDFLLLALKIDACNLSLGFKLQLLCYSVKVFRWDEQYVYSSRYRLIVSVKKYLISGAIRESFSRTGIF